MATQDLPSLPLERIRSICCSLPETVEKETWGAPTFRVREKIFVSFGYSDVDVFEAGDQGSVLAAVMKAPPGEQESLLASGAPFFFPKYVGKRGWIGIGIDNDTDWAEIEEFVIESYCETAPPSLARQVLDRSG